MMNWADFRLKAGEERTRVLAVLPEATIAKEPSLPHTRLWSLLSHDARGLLHRPPANLSFAEDAASIYNVFEGVRRDGNRSVRLTIYFFRDPYVEQELKSDLLASDGKFHDQSLVALIHTLPADNYDAIRRLVMNDTGLDPLVKEVTEDPNKGDQPQGTSYKAFRAFVDSFVNPDSDSLGALERLISILKDQDQNSSS